MNRPAWVMVRSTTKQPPALLKATGPAPPWWGASYNYERYRLPSLTAYSAQVDTYRTLSFVQSAVSILSETAAIQPLNVMRRMGEDTEDITNHPFEVLLDRPNPLQSRKEFFQAVFSFLALSGNSYIWLNRSSESQPPSEMWVIPSNHILPIPDGRLAIRGYMYEPGGVAEKIPLEPWEVVHLRRFNPINRYVGLSPIEAVGNTIIGDKAMSEWNAKWFDKDNAKIPGMLGFAENYEEGEWERLQAKIKQDYGGTERALLMLRGLGTGDVKWIDTGMSQKDMEFLQGRAFNKEEIFLIFAPGLDAATSKEAALNNSRSNEATYMGKAVWPLLVGTAQKFTNDVLPAYGTNLICEFDDPRIKDRQMDLNEQAEAQKVMTVEEVRERYYQLGPLGDERDKLLVTQAGSPFAGGIMDNPFEGGSRNNGNKPGQLDSGNEEAPEDDVEEPVKARIEVQPTKAQLMRDELGAWERFVVKRLKGGQQSWREFVTDHVPDTLKAAIEGGLEAVKTADEARLVFQDALAWHQYP